MTRHLISRILATAVLGLAFGCYVHHGYVQWNQRGREAFSVYEMHRFDYYMSAPRPMGRTIFRAAIALAGLLAVYESIALGLSVILQSAIPDGRNN